MASWQKKKSLASSSHFLSLLLHCVYYLWISLREIRNKAFSLQCWFGPDLVYPPTPVEYCYNITTFSIKQWTLMPCLVFPFSHAGLSYPISHNWRFCIFALDTLLRDTRIKVDVGQRTTPVYSRFHFTFTSAVLWLENGDRFISLFFLSFLTSKK